MFVKIIFGIGVMTVVFTAAILGIGLWDYLKNPQVYKENIDREPWRK